MAFLGNMVSRKLFGNNSGITKAKEDISLSERMMGDSGGGGGDHEASNRMAGILRRDWDSYMENYAPYDAKLREMVMGDADNEAAIDRARETTRDSFAASREAGERDRSRAGLSLAQDEADVINRRSQRNGTLAEVNAANQTRLHMQDRDMQMMAGNMAGGLRQAATDPMGAY
ncbi:hypothetical protein [uncultured Gilvimarinus sp.]|uniref:hypothetical protein n=1 Tax=uncultured Gilvimarinus sp. TaxID=1689143 RepID=UPI0030EBF882|tara:strand:+ start:7520 stop:8038 length:519 start_codon:yes stop_codon:yes gene_type:complete